MGSRHCSCLHLTLLASSASLHRRTLSMSLYGHSWFNSQRRLVGSPLPFSYLGTGYYIFIYGLKYTSCYFFKNFQVVTEHRRSVWDSVSVCVDRPVLLVGVGLYAPSGNTLICVDARPIQDNLRKGVLSITVILSVQIFSLRHPITVYCALL